MPAFPSQSQSIKSEPSPLAYFIMELSNDAAINYRVFSKNELAFKESVMRQRQQYL